MSQTIRLTRRAVSTKRHTLWYSDARGNRYTPRQAARLARSGRIDGARAVGNHIQAAEGRRRLSNLPTTVQR